ncbi:adaptin ear-binding coat-associated protein 1 [Podospora australis]|uniref:Adaptin ear-binding coat-associated protein 1 n=1 Tax=Podospora australis TaxID=1536484 RepID=A0AAN7ALV8_9PEZI|nr:adaptin ear-binding coat-associated protein 1 [Podospora australis]
MDPPSANDPATGLPLPPDAIVRVLHITPKIHIYSLPPTSLSTSYTAASWTSLSQNPIFTARLRVLETTFDSPSSSSPESDETNTVTKVDILLEHPTTATLFAAAPFTASAIVTPCTDSSRFFALRIQDPSTKSKATIGIGFEERSEAFDFGVVLQECAKHLGFLSPDHPSQAAPKESAKVKKEDKKDYSLKEGETITVNLSNTKFGRRIRAASTAKDENEGGQGNLNSFALAPPPGSTSGGSPLLPPPPPNAREIRAQKRLSAQQMGFDDGKFGEFA